MTTTETLADDARPTPAPLRSPIICRIWVNGTRYASPEQATVSVRDHGLVVGDGVFEALKVIKAGPFSVQRHLDRLSRSAASLGLPAPTTTSSARASRPCWPTGAGTRARSGSPTPGVSVRSARKPPSGRPRWSSRPTRGSSPTPTGTIVTVPWTRNENGAMAGMKSTSYAENVRGLAFADRTGADESIFVNTAGHVCEGTGSNIFFVFGSGADAEVVTPPLSAGPLRGVTRDLLLEWCDDHRARPHPRPGQGRRRGVHHLLVARRARRRTLGRPRLRRGWCRRPPRSPGPSPSAAWPIWSRDRRSVQTAGRLT